jgi:transposase
MGPLIRTSLAPIAQTPVLRTRAKHRQKVSVAAALFRSAQTGKARLVHETFVDQYVNDFLYASFLQERVVRGARRPLILLQDGAPLHHGHWTQDFIEDQFPKLVVYEFPAYAPELNPTEQLWKWTKYEELANFLPDSLDQLAIAAEHVVKVAENDQKRLQAFFAAAELSW